MDTFGLQLLDSFQHDERYTTSRSFLGVFPRDKLSELEEPRQPLTLTVNSHKHDKPGQHLLALYVTSKSKVSFFDLFPKTCLIHGVEIDKFICDNYLGVQGVYRENRTRIQHPNSEMCGLFCALFLYYFCRGLSMIDIVNKFEYLKNLWWTIIF